MKTKSFILAGVAALMVTTGVAYSGTGATAAQVVITSAELAHDAAVKRVYNDLSQQGYAYIVVSKSMLGRAVVQAYDGAQRREVVINTATGEVIRDARATYAGYPSRANVTAQNAGQNAAATATNAAAAATNAASNAADTAASHAGNVIDHVVDNFPGGGNFGIGN